MAFWLGHWHCILPVAAVLVAVLLMTRRNPQGDGDGSKSDMPPLNMDNKENE